MYSFTHILKQFFSGLELLHVSSFKSFTFSRYGKLHISYRVTGLYRLGKTCYLHSLVCNNSIICIVYCAILVLLHSLLCKMILFQFAHGKMITQPTLTPPQTRDWWRAIVCAEIVSRGRHMTKHCGSSEPFLLGS